MQISNRGQGVSADMTNQGWPCVSRRKEKADQRSVLMETAKQIQSTTEPSYPAWRAYFFSESKHLFLSPTILLVY